MFASRSDLRDPSPEAAPCDLSGLDWEASWDSIQARLTTEDWDAPVLSGELTDCSDEAIVAEAARLERRSRWVAARGYELVAELARRRPDPSGSPDELGISAYAVDEIAVSTGISRWAACRRVAEADALTHRHPQLLVALSAGCVTVPAVLRVLDATAVLDPADCATVERRLLDRAGRPVLTTLGSADPADLETLSLEQVMAVSAKATPAYLGRVARDLAQRLDPEVTRKRETKAKDERSVRLDPPVDGIACLIAQLPSAAALAAYEHLNQLAHALPVDIDGVRDPRSMDAKRADTLVDLLLGAAIRTDDTLQTPAPINIHVIIDRRRNPAQNSRDDGSHGGFPGEIAGLGPVTADTLRDLLDLAEHTSGTVDGAIAVNQTCPGADVHQAEGPGPYAPPERLKNLLRVRHRRCVFPGCARPSRKCELDHTIPHPQGPTCICNLAPLCVHHHHLKHHAPGWTLHNHGNGRLTWTTPTGRRIQVGQGPEPPGPTTPETPPSPPRPEDIPPF